MSGRFIDWIKGLSLWRLNNEQGGWLIMREEEGAWREDLVPGDSFPHPFLAHRR